MTWKTMDTAPKDGTPFLACCEDDCLSRNHWIVRWNAEQEIWCCSDDADGLTIKVSVPCLGYWMPLEPPPRKTTR